MNESYDTLKVLLTKYKDTIDVNRSTSINFTPLHLFCGVKNIVFRNEIKKRPCLKELKVFLSNKNLNPNEQESTHLKSPLHLAVINSKDDFVSALLDLPSIDVNIQDDKKETPLHIACLRYNFFSNNTVKCDILRLLLNSKDIDINIKDSKVFCFFF